jgi:hypothetical protein
MEVLIMRLNRRSLALCLMGGLAAPGLLQKAHAAADAAYTLENMVEALQGQSTLSFVADMEFGASAEASSRRRLGSSVHVVFERGGRLLASYGGPLDVQLLIASGEATLYRPSQGLKSLLKPVSGGSAFAVPGLFLPFLGLLSSDVKTALFGDIQSVTPLQEGTSEQPETTNLVAVMAGLFTGEVWIRKGESIPTRLIGTFFDAPGGRGESAGLTFSGWSANPLAEGAFDLPGLDQAKDVQLSGMGL